MIRSLKPRAVLNARRVLLQLALGYLREAEIDRYAIDIGLRATWTLSALRGVTACSLGLRGEPHRHGRELLQRRVEALCQIAEVAGRGIDYRKTTAGRNVGRQAVKAARKDLKKLVRMFA